MAHRINDTLTNLNPSSIESYMYADLKENHVLCDMDKNTPTNAERPNISV